MTHRDRYPNRQARRLAARLSRRAATAALAAGTATGGLVVTGLGARPAAAATPAAQAAASPAAATPQATGPNLPGYWMATADGGIASFGGVPVYGAAASQHLAAPIVGIVPTPDGGGYWQVSADGGVFNYGDAGFFGSAGHLHLSAPIVGMAATPTGGGYWLVGSDGGIFCFGDAGFHGSTGNIHLNQPIVGMAATPTGLGYWLVARDGGIFTGGDAGFYGSTGNIHLNKPIVGMAASPSGHGYWLVGSDGGIFNGGDAGFYGSTGSIHLNKPIVGMQRTADGRGYWLVASDGGIFNGGDAVFRGSATNSPSPVVGIAVAPGLGTAITSDPSAGLAPSTPYPSGSIGYDVSWPQCGSGLPGGSFNIAIVGVNDGRAGTVNPCLATQAQWAGNRLNDYINMNSPNGSTYGAGATGPAGNCASSDASCWSYNYGWTSASWSEGQASAVGAHAHIWWLDVETGNYWSGNLGANARVIQGAIDELHSHGLTVGVYSTSYQWGAITGGARPGVPVWYATGSGSLSGMSAYCTPSHSFTGGPVWLIQGGLNGLDGNYAC